ncbi:MAG: aminoacyl--tRNA ligase-related protein, partial [Bryobacteraceae bacterium]
MLDAKEIRSNPERLREAIRLRGVDPQKADLDRWLELDEVRRKLRSEADELNAEKKKLAGLGRTDPAAARQQGQTLREKSRRIEEEVGRVTAEWQAILDWFPNWPHPGMPRGEGADDNIEECAWIPGSGYVDPGKLGKGEYVKPFMPQTPIHAAEPGFPPLHYSELGEKLGGIDTLQAGKVSGSRFAYILGDIARMQLGIQHLLASKLLQEGYQPIVPPLLVRERALYGTSHFPEGRDQVYEIGTENVEEKTSLYLVGSSEPANFGYFMDRTLDEQDLPFKIFAITPCFRSEAGSWGKDVRGIKRVHQFDKLEMNAVCTPPQSEAMYEEFRKMNEWLLQQLQLPYHVVDKCARDAGYLASHRQRDVEVWLSGSQEFMEVMTDTNTTDYQTRRLGIRYKSSDGNSRFCHTVNDTGCAMGRMLIA